MAGCISASVTALLRTRALEARPPVGLSRRLALDAALYLEFQPILRRARMVLPGQGLAARR